jgi:hypothetical protein
VKKLVSDFWQACGFLQGLQFHPSIKLCDHHDITEILLKVALSINPNPEIDLELKY